MTNEVKIPLRDYLAAEEQHRREWMVSTFATKDDLSLRNRPGAKGERCRHRDVAFFRPLCYT